jgi:hypothetical protein
MELRAGLDANGQKRRSLLGREGFAAETSKIGDEPDVPLSALAPDSPTAPQ